MKAKKISLIFILLFYCTVVCASTKVGSCKADIFTLHTALKMLHLDMKRYPTNLEGMSLLLVSSDAHWKGPYISKNKIPTDPWGNQFRYRLIDNEPVIDSAGPDGLFNTNDDIDMATELKQKSFFACCST